ncbi:MAG: LacI family DNA-binding transcriptional regulator [Sphaerochaetaceae bacterium]
MKNVTIKDIANIAGVSETTVSLSFQPNSRISKATRERVLKVAHDLRYVRNSVAQNLRGGRTKTIGFIVNDINNYIYHIMSTVAAQIGNQFGFQLLYADTQWDPSKAIEVTKTMLAKQVEGFMLSLNEKEDVSLDLIRHANIPYVVIDTIPKPFDGAYVVNDGVEIGKIAATHFAELGCKRVAFFNASKEMSLFSAFTQQIEGLESSLHSFGIPFSGEDIFYAGLTVEEGNRACTKLLERGACPYDGILCVNDYVAYGVMQTAEKHGIKIGRDLALIGIDNLEFSALDRISLSSIAIDYHKMTTLAVSKLIDSIEGPKEMTYQKTLAPKLIIRESTRTFGKGK